MFQSNDLPILQDIQTVQGSDFSFPFFIGCPTSGYGFNAFTNVPASGLGIIPFAVNNNDQINGGVSLYMPHATTSGIPAGQYPWQFSYTDLNGLVTTFMQGVFLVLPSA